MRGGQEKRGGERQCQGAADDASALVNGHSGFLQKCEQIQTLEIPASRSV
jgi:hypothetical protein